MTAVMDADPIARRRAAEARDCGRSRRPAGDEIGELVDAWDELGRFVPDDAALIGVDMAVHLYDVSESVGVDVVAGGPVIADTLQVLDVVQKVRLRRHGLDPLTMICTDSGAVIGADGPGGPGGAVSGTEYDLFRCLGGRRDRQHADTLLDWDHVSPLARDLFSIYGWSTSPAPGAARVEREAAISAVTLFT